MEKADERKEYSLRVKPVLTAQDLVDGFQRDGNTLANANAHTGQRITLATTLEF